jgi:glycerol-3-phosphate acyltransferase PlsY
MELTLGLVAAYLLGSIPFALLTVRVLAGVDLRTIGSGNVGASNAARAFGAKTRYLVFLLVYLLDFGKGFLPSQLFSGWFGMDENVTHSVLLGSAAILGHCTSPFLKFKGGKGVATATGVAFVLSPLMLGIGIGAYFVAMLLTRQAFIGSLSLVTTFAVGVILQDPGGAFGPELLPRTLFCLLLLVFLVFTHRSNIQKYLARSSSE